MTFHTWTSLAPSLAPNVLSAVEALNLSPEVWATSTLQTSAPFHCLITNCPRFNINLNTKLCSSPTFITASLTLVSNHRPGFHIAMFDPAPPPPLDDCPFCTIASTFKPYDPHNPPTSIDPELTCPSAFIALSTPTLVAFLDIMPLSPGHLLVCPRSHRPKLSDVSHHEAQELGGYLRILSKAMIRATGIEDWNVVQNNGAAASQVVPHTHYHIIPRPEIRASGRHSESFTMFGKGQREELDDDEAVKLAEGLRTCVAEVLKAEEEEMREKGQGKAKL